MPNPLKTIPWETPRKKTEVAEGLWFYLQVQKQSTVCKPCAMVAVEKGSESSLVFVYCFLFPVYHTSLAYNSSSCVAIMHWKNKCFCLNNTHLCCECSTLREVLAVASPILSMCSSQLLVICTACSQLSHWFGVTEFPPNQQRVLYIPEVYCLKGVFKKWHAMQTNIAFQPAVAIRKWMYFQTGITLN